MPYSVLKPEAIQAPEHIAITATSKVVQGVNITTLNIAWTQVKGAVGYIVQWRKDDGNWITLPKTASQSLDIDGVYAGNYMAQVQAIDAFDNESLATSSQLTHIAGKTGRPPRLARLTATGLLFAMRLEWVFNKGSGDTAYTEIQVSPDGRSNIATLGQFAYPTNSHTINGLQGNLTQHYRARIVDKLGNTSEWTAWVSGTTDAQADKVLDLLQGQISQSHLDQSLRTPIGKIGGLETAVAGVNGQLGTLNQSLATAQRELSTAQNTLNTAVANITTERNRISSAIRDITALQSANTAKTAELASLTQTVNGHTSSIRELGVTTGDLSQKYSQIKTQADKSTSEITAIKQTQSGQATSIERLNSDMANKASIANLNTVRETLATADSALGRRIDAVSAEFKQADNTIKASVQAETQARTNADNALSQRINALDSAYKTADNQASARISQLEQSLASKDAAMARRVDGLQANYTALDNRTKWTELTSTQDLNNLTTQGNYFIRATNNTNAPHNGWLYVRVDVPRTDRLTQTAWADNNPSLRYMRTRSGTTWHGWQKQATGSELDSKASSASLAAEQKARADADSALSSRITALDSAYKAADAAMRANITNAQQSATNAQNAVAIAQSQLNAKIDGINVGGRNLLLGSHATRSTHGTTAFSVSQNIDLARVRQLVLSCDVKYTNARRASTQGAKWFRIGAEIRIVWTDGTSNWYGAWRANVANASSFHGRVALKISVPAGKTIHAIDNAKIQIWDILGDGMLVKNAKLEIGNVATDWTPAPEDTSTATSALQASVDEFKSAQATKDNATAAKLTQLESNLNSKANASALNQTNTKVSQAEGRITAEANKVSTLQTTVGQHTASIQQQAQSINGLRAQWTLKVESGGIVSGIGLASANGKSAFAIRANQFYVADPTGTAKRPMFSVLTSPQTINGVTVPAGTYISSAYIQNGSITTAHIANASIDSAKIKDGTITNAKIANGSITTAKIGTAQIDTLQIKGEAVIVPRVQFTESAFEFYDIDTEKVINSITVDAKGGAVAISFGFESLMAKAGGNNDGKNGVVILRIKRGGTTIRTLRYSTTHTYVYRTERRGWGAEDVVTHHKWAVGVAHRTLPTILDLPPAGQHTYTVTLESRGLNSGKSSQDRATHPVVITARSIQVMAVKR